MKLVYYRLFFFLLICSNAWAAKPALVSLTRLRCDYRDNPLGVESRQPRLSWQIVSAVRGQKQTAYRILVSDNPKTLAANQGNLWDSGKRISDQSIQVAYEGKPLQAGQSYFWKVQTWDKDGQPSVWSAPATWQMGLPDKSDWGKAQWIALEDLPASERIVPFVHNPTSKKPLGDRQSAQNALPQFRKEFSLKKPLKRATAFISGLGHYELKLNGQRVKDHFIDPGWTNYDQYALYATYDLTTSLRKGANVLGVLLGNGFYNIPVERYRKIVGSFGYPKLICNLQLEYTDGSKEQIVTDQSWKVTKSPITYSSIYGGEDWDARNELTNWMSAGYNDSNWQTPLIVQGSPQLRSQTAPPVKIMETFTPVRITEPKPGVFVVDLGQNMSGIPQISVRGKTGSVVKITPGELLGDDSLVTQKATGDPHFYQYTLKGSGSETWQPRFTYYGFRYLQIEGAVPDSHLANVPSKPVVDLPVLTAIKGLHIRGSAETVGTFSCSNDLFNRIDRLITWAIKSNMVSTLTDCPHREKLGWLEETHLMSGSARYTYDLATLLPKIIRDMQSAQLANGLIPDIAPEYTAFVSGFRDSPEWGSAGVILPWYTYQWYGDKSILTESYDMMKKYVAYLGTKANDHILTHGLGDWCDLGPKPPGESQLTPKGITATATYYYDLTILEKTARLLGKTADADQFQQLAESVKKAFNGKYYDAEKGYYGSGSQTSNAMPIYMNLVTPENKATVTASLLKSLKDNKYSLTAGDIGFRYLLLALTKVDASDAIYAMNNRSDVPGYGYQLAHGATALTESWPALRFVSNNHFMLGHLMEWLYSGLGGIQQDENVPGFKAIVIKPELVGDITQTNVRYVSPYGPIRSDWKKTGQQLELTVSIPANTTATVFLPASVGRSISESGKPLENRSDVKVLRTENDKTVLAIGAGMYVFTVQ
ncbi:glycoside hydrolase family 78 protein [Larkinella terrae]|uniref:alpha-L-rhamnosidase n=1 Tax=Larkinella terrae TaxID=2025311 RepID=A0A7K0EK37_9BACT|nr:glycoside hydrolase family 78 protein [Larkinella terrae]MRS62230.1 Bacterial alpha-L-rhamnosidase [Larkinella terrae]